MHRYLNIDLFGTLRYIWDSQSYGGPCAPFSLDTIVSRSVHVSLCTKLPHMHVPTHPVHTAHKLSDSFKECYEHDPRPELPTQLRPEPFDASEPIYIERFWTQLYPELCL